MAGISYLYPIDLVLNEIRNAVAHLLATDPGSPTEGQFWYNTTTHVWKFYNGTAVITLGRLDQMAAGADVAFGAHKLTGVADPTGAQDVATKAYVDNLTQGIAWKAAVRAATTVNGTLVSAYANGQVIDGVTLATGDRILVKDQTAGAENGLYTVNASGVPTRAPDADTAAEILQAAAFVEEGTVNADTVWVNTTNAPITLGTTALVFVKFGSTTSTGPAKYAASIGDGASVAIAVVHNLGTTDVLVQLHRVASPFDWVIADVEITDANTVTFRFSTAPTTNQFRAVVIG